jgi:broad specificity phosphatase PhoE
MFVFARHAETELNAARRVSGDPGASQELTEAGRAQCEALGASLAEDPIDLCVVTGLGRTEVTARHALGRREIPRMVLHELSDPRLGSFEQAPFEVYERWVMAASLTERPPGGGESQLDVVRRYARGFRLLLERPERCIAVICHALPIAVLLTAASAEGPALRGRYRAGVAHAVPHRVTREVLQRGEERLRIELGQVPDR